jgi:hypothetical protein
MPEGKTSGRAPRQQIRRPWRSSERRITVRREEILFFRRVLLAADFDPESHGGCRAIANRPSRTPPGPKTSMSRISACAIDIPSIRHSPQRSCEPRGRGAGIAAPPGPRHRDPSHASCFTYRQAGVWPIWLLGSLLLSSFVNARRGGTDRDLYPVS